MAYVSLAEIRGWLGLPDSYDDDELSSALSAAERAIDRHCGWSFDLDGSATAKVFPVEHAGVLDVAASGFTIASTSGLIVKSDADDDGVFETTWTAADYELLPLNGRRSGLSGWPYLEIRAVGDYLFPVGGVRSGRVQVTAVWGWAAVPSSVTTAAILLTVAWHQRRATLTGRGGFDGFFASAIQADDTITDALAPYRYGRAIVGMG